jgi:hypothetical protein
MSQAVDEYLLEDMRKDENDELMFSLGLDEEGFMIDTVACYDEEAGIYPEDQGMLFPQPIREIS